MQKYIFIILLAFVSISGAAYGKEQKASPETSSAPSVEKSEDACACCKEKA